MINGYPFIASRIKRAFWSKLEPESCSAIKRMYDRVLRCFITITFTFYFLDLHTLSGTSLQIQSSAVDERDQTVIRTSKSFYQEIRLYSAPNRYIAIADSIPCFPENKP